MIEFTNLSGTAWKVGESLTRLENIPQTGYVEFQFNAVAVTFVTSQGVYTDDEIEFYADWYRTSVLSIYDDDKPTLVEILPTGYRWHHEDEKLLYIYFSNGTDEAYTNSDLLAWFANNCTPSLAQTTWKSNYILTPIGENPRHFLVGEVKLNTNKLPYTLNAPTFLYLGGEDDEVIVSFGEYNFNSAGYRIIGGEVTDEKLVTVTFGNGTQAGVFDADLAAWFESNFTQIKATVGRLLSFGAIIVPNGAIPQPHGEELIPVDTNEPTTYVRRWNVSRNANDSVRAYLTGTSNNYELHFYGYGACKEYGTYNQCEWNNYAIKKVVFHDGVTTVPQQGLGTNSDKNTLNSLVIPSTVRSIRPAACTGAFVGTLTALASLTVGNGVRRIHNTAFSESALTSVTIPNSVQIIDNNAFRATPWFNNQTTQPVIVGDGVLLKDNMSTANRVVPNEVKFISGLDPTSTASVGYNRTITSLTLPSRLKGFGRFSATFMTNLTSLTLPNGVEWIGTVAFRSYAGQTINIPLSMRILQSRVFLDCSNMTHIYIPSTVKEIWCYEHDTNPASSPATTLSPFNGCSSSLTIYCEAESKPAGWDDYWNYISSTAQATVVWNTSRARYNEITGSNI